MNERLIIVSNRLPVQTGESNGAPTLIPSAGGLVSSIKSYLQAKMNSVDNTHFRSALWIGALDISQKKFNKMNLGPYLQDEDFALHPVFLPPGTQDKHYNGFCNDTIWPLFHYFPSYAKFKDEHFEHYRLANKLFCEAILAVYEPGDVIWIHDYHLMLLPAMLREKLPGAAIGFFLHIPFPSFELFRMLPGAWRTGILEGLLGADLVGFHTTSYAQYFQNSVKQLLGYETSPRTVVTPERSIAVDVFPVGIDFLKFHSVLNQSEIFVERNRIRKKIGEAQLVISVDRLDYTKGIINRLEGFELFLQQHPEYHHKVTFLMVIVPSRDIILKYKELKEQIEGLVGRINGRIGTLDWTPVIYQYRSLDFVHLTGLYAAADVALITPVRDGMNLVSKEFVASRSDKRGVLILSEAAGAAAELGEAIIVNPTDRREVSAALYQALNMPAQEQINRNDFMQRRIRNYNVVRWADEFLAQLAASHVQQQHMKMKVLTKQAEQNLQQRYADAQRRLLFLDYDGTLAPLTRFPGMAAPQPALHELLTRLTADARNTIVVASGRSKSVLEDWLGSHRIDIIAEHGAYYRRAGSSWEQASTEKPEWKEMVHQAMNMFTDRCPGSFIEEKEMSLAWHYRNAEYELGFLRSRELHNNLVELAAHLGFQVTEGKKVIEVRPHGVDKGSAALHWLNGGEYDFIFAAGDDRTDEDLFRVIPPDGHTIRVGLVHSTARFNVSQQKDLPRILEGMVSHETVKAPQLTDLAVKWKD